MPAIVLAPRQKRRYSNCFLLTVQPHSVLRKPTQYIAIALEILKQEISSANPTIFPKRQT
jgi:hypothetical protein